MSDSRWVKCVAGNGFLRGVGIDATDVVREAARRHKLRGRSAVGLGEALISGLMLSSYCKNGERINLNVKGSNFLKQAVVDAHWDGRVRGYLVERSMADYDFDTNSDPKGPWGEGYIAVLKTRENEKKVPYVGSVVLLTGFLPKDLTFYWHQSEQIRSSVGIAININDKGDVESAGGFLVQALAGAPEDDVENLEAEIKEIDSLNEMISKDVDPTKILTDIFQNSAFMILEEKKLKFECNCSQERVERSLMTLGIVELSKILKEDGEVEMNCDFCVSQYHVSKERLENLIQELGS